MAWPLKMSVCFMVLFRSFQDLVLNIFGLQRLISGHLVINSARHFKVESITLILLLSEPSDVIHISLF